jgi:hypothetical protein
VTAHASTLFLDEREIRSLVPIGFVIVIVGNGVEAWRFRFPIRHKRICHADNRGGVQAATEFGEHWGGDAEPPPDRAGEQMAEMLFIVAIGAIVDAMRRIELPVGLRQTPVQFDSYERAWRDRADADIRREMGRWVGREISRNEFFA